MFSLDQKDIELPLYPNGVYDKKPTIERFPEKQASIERPHAKIPEEKTELSALQTTKLGIIFSLLTPLIWVVSSTVSRFVPRIPPVQFIFLRGLLTILPYYVYLHYANKVDDLKANLKNYKLYFNAFLANVSTILFYVAMTRITLNETYTIYSTIGILNGLLASFILKDPYTNLEKILGLVSFLGVILIVRPPIIFGYTEEDLTPHANSSISHAVAGCLAFFSAVTASLYLIGVRASRSNVDPYVMTFYVNASTVFWYGLYFLLFGEYITPTFSEYFGCFVFGALSIAALVVVSFALKYATPSVVGILDYAQLVFSLLVDIILFGEYPAFLTIVGALLILGSCLYLVMKQKA